jgi:hypothetical protein
MRQADSPVSLWITILVRDRVITYLASGNLSIVTERVDSWGLHQSGSGTIYSKSAFWDAIPFIISPHFWRGEQELNATVGQDVN